MMFHKKKKKKELDDMLEGEIEEDQLFKLQLQNGVTQSQEREVGKSKEKLAGRGSVNTPRRLWQRTKSFSELGHWGKSKVESPKSARRRPRQLLDEDALVSSQPVVAPRKRESKRSKKKRLSNRKSFDEYSHKKREKEKIIRPRSMTVNPPEGGDTLDEKSKKLFPFRRIHTSETFFNTKRRKRRRPKRVTSLQQ